ncbi:MAG: PH domain-containing protein [Erysipelotrichales bacterium]|nr:PH domain-containing protein [Erysipelotrichales bacterium]
MNESCYGNLKLFTDKYPHGVTWFRLKKHCEIIDKHLNPGETIDYVIAGQLDDNHFSFFNTGVLAVTSERLLVAQNRLIVGYKLSSITPELYNDMQVDCGLLWGTLCIDTVKEKIYISNLDKRSLPEIETSITTFMHEAKKKNNNEEIENES